MAYFVYSQSTGRFYDGTNPERSVLMGIGYSGSGSDRNNPRSQSMPRRGPIPRGVYTVDRAKDHPRLGPISIPLIPWPTNQMFGRSAFLIHGDNAKGDGSASEGCIILGRNIREEIARKSTHPFQGWLVVVE